MHACLHVCVCIHLCLYFCLYACVWISVYHIVFFSISASLLSMVGDIGKSYVVWEEIFDNGLKVQSRLQLCGVEG